LATANDSKVVAAYYPGAGQYWLSFADYPQAELAIAGSLPNLVAGEEIAPFPYVVAGGMMPYGPVSIASGALPIGLSMNPQGVVYGVPTTPGTYDWTVTVSDSGGATAVHPDSSTVVVGPPPPSISGSPPVGQMLVSYSYQFTLEGDFPPLVVTEVAGSLPDGLTISTSGLLSGTPEASFDGTITLRVTDARGVHSDSTFPLQIRDIAHWNAADKAGVTTLSDGDRVMEVVVPTVDGGGGAVRAVQARSTGRYYVEFLWERYSPTYEGAVGIMTAAGSLTDTPYAKLYSAVSRQGNQFSISNTTSSQGEAVAQGGRVGIAVDLDLRRCWIHVDGVWRYDQSPASNPTGLLNVAIAAGAMYPVGFSTDNDAGLSHQIRLVIKGNQMLYRPTGFLPWGGV